MQRITKSCVLPLQPARTWFLLIKDLFINPSSSSSHSSDGAFSLVVENVLCVPPTCCKLLLPGYSSTGHCSLVGKNFFYLPLLICWWSVLIAAQTYLQLVPPQIKTFYNSGPSSGGPPLHAFSLWLCILPVLTFGWFWVSMMPFQCLANQHKI